MAIGSVISVLRLREKDIDHELARGAGDEKDEEGEEEEDPQTKAFIELATRKPAEDASPAPSDELTVVQRYLEGSIPELPTSVEDVYQTMAVVDAAHTSADTEGIAPAYR